VADGRDPSGLIRDPAANECIELPIAARHLFTEGLTREQLLAHPILGKHLADYPFQAGQPDEVKAAYRQAMGLSDEDVQTR